MEVELFLRRYPNSGFGWKILSGGLMAQNKDALYALQQTARLLPQDAEVLNNLGDALARRDLSSEAETCFRRAITLKPNYEDALHNLGVILVQAGKIKEAEEYFLKVLSINPGCMEARYFLAQNQKSAASEANFLFLSEIAHRLQHRSVSLPLHDQFHLHYALGKYQEQAGHLDSAFIHFMEGARIKRQTLRYSASSESRNVDALIDFFTPDTLSRLKDCANPSDIPIFIVGMPRSGTTLTEQIIASHPDVYGAGELTDLLNIVQRDIDGTTYPDNLLRADKHLLSTWANEYISHLRRRNPDAKHITDKLPGNFMFIGLIHLILPNAKIIHVNRNPMDICLSCFTTLFVNDNVPWSYNFEELGRYYADYSRLMAHWRNTLPDGAFLDIRYEDIVQDRETQARKIIRYCGLEWNDLCLESHKTDRSVKTASMFQVRKPLYTSSIERWRRYESQLSPLLQILQQNGTLTMST